MKSKTSDKLQTVMLYVIYITAAAILSCVVGPLIVAVVNEHK